MKIKNNKKGFTLVELVIVIAVIAILAAVLIPTFASVIGNANRSAARSEAHNLQVAIMAESKANFDGYCDELMVETETSHKYTNAADFKIGDEDFTAYVKNFKAVDGTVVTVYKSTTDGAYIEYTTKEDHVVKIYANKILVDGKE